MITELTIATLVACVLVHEASVAVLLNSIFFQQAHSRPLGRIIELPSTPCASCLTFRAVPVESHNCNDSITRVAGRLRVPTMHSRDILHQAKGDHLGRVHSDGSREYQAGEAGPVEL